MKGLLRSLFFLTLVPAWGLAQDGYVDQVSCTTISGWAYLPGGNPQNPVTVAFVSDGVQFGTALANLYRADVQAAIGGNGLYGFNIATPSLLKDGQTHSILVKVVGGLNLMNSGTSQYLSPISCTGQTPYYTYTESVTTNPAPSDPGNWNANGTINSASPGGSFIYSQIPSGWNSEYEIRSNITLNTSGGNYQQYVRAQANALGGGSSSYLVELQNPTFTSNGSCTATLVGYQQLSGTSTLMFYSVVPCHQSMVMRTVAFAGTVWTLIDGQVYGSSTALTTGSPGFGANSVPSGNGITQVSIGPRNLAAPAQIDGKTLAYSPFADHVDVRWQDPVDTTGVGIVQYNLLRSPGANTTNFAFVGTVYGQTAFTDESVSASTAYTYAVCQVSFHGIGGGCPFFDVMTPDPGNVDPRRYGVRPTGSYWGDKGEKIDTLSGNLNYTLPLFKAMSRGGGGVTFSLSYNSQMWRQDNGGTWLFGEDVGYGMGWKLQAGSLTPYWGASWSAIDHYLFIDSTGTEYKLYDPGHTGVWTSADSVYVSYEAGANMLHFNDGSSWLMGCSSGGQEADLGTMYPTQIEDSNGNYILITYYPGAGTSWPNSSARINIIYDVRSTPGVSQPTYTFNYDLSSGELASITSAFGGSVTPQAFAFTTAIQSLSSPMSGIQFNNANVLTSVTAGPGYTTSFTYDGGAELSQVTFPTGGHLRYDYLTWSYRGATTGQIREIREVSNRYLSMNSNGTGELTYPIGRNTDPNDGSLGVHQWCTLADPSGIGFKVWFFNSSTSTPIWQLGLIQNFQERVSTSNSFAPRQSYYTWTQDTAGNAYISTKQTLWDGGMGYQVNSYEDQTVDTFGNILTRNVRDYSNASTPIRKYTYTYVTDSNYTSRYIRNRLATATVTDGFGNNAVTLVSNQYDLTGGVPAGCGATAPNYTSPALHDAAYTSTFPYRGNLTVSTTPSGPTCTLYDLLGNTYFTKAPHSPGVAVSSGSGANNALPTAITANGDGNSTVSLTYSSMFAPSGFTGPNGDQTNATYDGWGRVTSSMGPDGAQTNYTYSAAGTLPMWQLAVTGYPAVGGALINGGGGYPTPAATNIRWTQTTLDGLGRTVQVQSGPGSTPNNAVAETDTVYGPCACSPTGKMTQVSQPFVPGATKYWTTYAYDAIGRTVTVTAPDGSATNTVYQANTTKVTDPAGKWKTTTVDVQGNVTQVAEPDPSNGSNTLYTNYTYDTMEHLTQVSMPRTGATQTRTFSYSGTTHLLTSETHPETGTTTYAYTPAVPADQPANDFSLDLVYVKTDANGTVTRYAYDAYDRVTTIYKYPRGAGAGGTWAGDDPCQRVTYTYDSANSGTYSTVGAWGHVAAVTTGGSGCSAAQQFTQMFSYNPAGRVFTKRLELLQGGSVTGWNVGYTYDLFGQTASTSYPAGGPVYTVGFDSMQRPYLLKDASNSQLVQTVAYNPASQPTTTQFSSATEIRTYNVLNQLTGISAGNTTSTAINMTYTYPVGSNNGQISSDSDTVANQVVSYGYDALKRLTSASATGTNAWSQTYSYDGFGNLTAKSGSGAVFTNNVDQTTNRLAYGNYCYDPAGNMVSDANGGGCSNPNYVYDASNRLVSVVSGGGGVGTGGGTVGESYAYGADNKRLSRTTSAGAETIYIYGAGGEKVAVWNATSNTYTFNIFFSGRLIGQLLPGTITAPPTLLFTDRLGSVRGTISPGTGTSATKYLPYGEELSATANDTIKFATYTRDSTTGLDYADQRFYTSQFGRFLSADRFKQAAKANDSGSWNKYAYTRGDPVNRADPGGTDDCPADFCATGTGYGDDPYGGFDGSGGGQKGNPKNQGNDPTNTAIARASQAAKALNDALKMWTNCVTALGGAGVVNSFTKGLTFLDGRLAGNLNQAGDPSNNISFVNYASNTGAFAADLLDSQKNPSKTIVLFANFFGDDPTDQAATLVHELFHAETQISDHYTLDIALKVTVGKNQDPSDALNNWIKNDCKNPKQ